LNLNETTVPPVHLASLGKAVKSDYKFRYVFPFFHPSTWDKIDSAGQIIVKFFCLGLVFKPVEKILFLYKSHKNTRLFFIKAYVSFFFF
jgi:hypothetical protein